MRINTGHTRAKLKKECDRNNESKDILKTSQSWKFTVDMMESTSNADEKVKNSKRKDAIAQIKRTLVSTLCREYSLNMSSVMFSTRIGTGMVAAMRMR